ncbi:MAG: DUF6064 family protein [Anaerolineales bacterium]
MFYFVAILLVGWLFLKPGKVQSLIIKSFLSIAFAWIGAMFYMILAKGMTGNSRGNYFLGALFILVSVQFVVDLFRQKMQFTLPEAGWQRYASLLGIGSTFCYPLFGTLSGHALTQNGIEGNTSCCQVAGGHEQPGGRLGGMEASPSQCTKP